ncbi:FRU protein, partial [Acromyrmex insinuator]
ANSRCFADAVVSVVAELKNWRISQIFERQSNSDERRRCSLCGKVVTNVRNHYYVHFPGKYACPLCPAVYTRSDTLLTHTRSMPSVPVGLSYHEMFAVSLNSPALWRCRACGKQVTNRWHHFHIHTAQRSLCPYCPATYSRIDTLRSHIRTKHREMLFAGKGSL